ncbi:MAG: DEAD/DEAH box helicase [Lachnospiraceae bacterium]|nr:DEAD/DEAH box helicase [Lachnospiraceae bacterium]
MENVLELFDERTQKWFQSALGEPTPVQQEAWPNIAAGRHVLVSAPTGTGKTLSAFLVFLDQMRRQAREGTLKDGLQLIYVSPLKSLAADIRENLRRPLDGIGNGAGAQEEITVGIRTGDTSQRDRQRMVRKPPHILIITPESLYLMLTSKTGQSVLATARAVIVDELHALIDTKRGAHLMLSLARLDALCGQPLQRIGLSATIAPLEAAAEYLAPEEVRIAAPVMNKKTRLDVLGPYADAVRGRRKDPVWEELGALVFQYCQGSRSVIAFVEGRRYAEKLAYYVNALGGEGFARVHHGSLSKEQRAETEEALRDGKLRLLCATSSMELGIDVGEIDQVLQVGCPRTVSSTMQRLGRAGHNPGRTSVMYLFPRTAAECVFCGMTAELAREGGVEQISPPPECLDVLAQHLVSMAAFRSYTLDEVMEILPRAWNFRRLTREDVRSVLGMLAGDYEHERDIPVRPRILYDRLHERVEGDSYSRMLAVSAGGTIPDKGLYTVKTEDGVRLGEVDEEFVYESQRGDRFILGAFAWKITNISRDIVTVVQAPVEGARLPFWKGEIKGRSKRTGEAFGRMFRGFWQAYEEGRLPMALKELGLDETAVSLASGYLERQIKAAGSLPDDRTILVEHFRDSSGNSQLMFHSLFGKRINAPLSRLAAQAAGELLKCEIGSVDEEDGFLLYSYGEETLPEGLLQGLDPDTCVRKLEIMLPATPVFNMAFRYNSGRALMMGVRNNSRQPLWRQRLKSAELLEQVVREDRHPLIRETRRECMQELWDAGGVRELLCDIRAGAVEVREIYTELPSPMSLPLQWAQEAAVMYDYAPTPRGIHAAVEDALKSEERLLQPGSRELLQVQEDILLREKLPKDERQLHALLMTEGDLAAGELEIPVEWLESLAQSGRVLYLEQGLWIAAEEAGKYAAALGETQSRLWNPGCGQQVCTAETGDQAHREKESCAQGICGEQLHIVRRMLRYRGAADAGQTAERYGWPLPLAEAVLEELCIQEKAVRQDGKYYHAELYRRARVRTLKNRREEIRTCPAEAYAALMLSHLESGAPAEECLGRLLRRYAGTTLPVSYWEGILLPRWVNNYRGEKLDAYLAEGELFWHMEGRGGLRFDFQEAIDWDAEPGAQESEMMENGLTEKEQLLYQTLQRRGASFMQSLNGVLGSESPYDTLMSLLEKGLVYADSFVPVRQWIEQEKARKATAKQRISMRVKALRAGRWDITRPLKVSGAGQAMAETLEKCFDRCLILCRETAAACGLPWQEALSVLRVWEYTGQARRGYFVEGLSGAQFIRGKDYASVIRELDRNQQPSRRELVWVNAVDPAQCWGKVLPHREGRSFMNIPGNAVACHGGMPIAVMERQGNTLRVFEEEHLEECLLMFAQAYRKGKIFPNLKRIVVKNYPDCAGEALTRAGFFTEMQDYVLYR